VVDPVSLAVMPEVRLALATRHGVA